MPATLTSKGQVSATGHQAVDCQLSPAVRRPLNQVDSKLQEASFGTNFLGIREITKCRVQFST